MSEDQEAPQAPEPAAVLLVEDDEQARALYALSLIHISEPTRPY